MGAWQRVGRGRGEGGHSVPRTAAAFGCRRAVGLLVLRAPSPTRQVVKLPTHHSAKHPLIKPSSNCPNGGDTCFLGGGGVGGTSGGHGEPLGVGAEGNHGQSPLPSAGPCGWHQEDHALPLLGCPSAHTHRPSALYPAATVSCLCRCHGREWLRKGLNPPPQRQGPGEGGLLG